ncbi:MAG: aldehyde-activating protein [Blastomonas sp. CACIA14H2]|uniref:GFA family protein n=1 Tax=Blastomonas sp. CACIA14H2 TaxID=1419876 RepID=UPI0003CFC2CB|nr:MAG: aldehyde-activating protein [Blastomonas sp. CACIA14H2]
MTVRKASCACGQATLECRGEPRRVSVCHCLDCQRRSGSVCAVQARWPDGDVAVSGQTRVWTRRGDGGSTACFHFCPECGVSVMYRADSMPGLVAIPVGLFADPRFPAPEYSVYEDRKHGWFDVVGEGIDHYA